MATIKEIADFSSSFGIILGVLLAFYGIDAWRREAMWKRRSELCEEVLALAYEIKEIISHIRSPGGFGGEGESRLADDGEPEDVRQKRNVAWIPIERYNQHLEKLSRLWALSYRFRAQFSTEEARPIEDLRDIINSIKSAAHILSVFWTSINWKSMDQEMREKNTALQDKYQDVIWEGNNGARLNTPDTPDEIQIKVNSAIQQLEITCREVLHAQHTIFGMLNAKLKLFKTSP